MRLDNDGILSLKPDISKTYFDLEFCKPCPKSLIEELFFEETKKNLIFGKEIKDNKDKVL